VGGLPLLCLPIRNTLRGGEWVRWSNAFALLTDTQRPLRIGKQSKGQCDLYRADPGAGVAYR